MHCAGVVCGVMLRGNVAIQSLSRLSFQSSVQKLQQRKMIVATKENVLVPPSPVHRMV